MYLSINLYISKYIYIYISRVNPRSMASRVSWRTRRRAAAGWPSSAARPYLSIYIYLSIYLSLYIYIYVIYIRRGTHSSACNSSSAILLGAPLSIYLYIYIYTYAYIYTYTSIYLSIYISIYRVWRVG